MNGKVAERMLVQFRYEVYGIAYSVAEMVALRRHHQTSGLAIADLRTRERFGTETAARLGGHSMFGIVYSEDKNSDIPLIVVDGLVKRPAPLPFPSRLHIIAA
jgi:hypothetical protein